MRVINNSPKTEVVKTSEKIITVQFGEVEYLDKCEAIFMIELEKVPERLETAVGCGSCTKMDKEKISDRVYNINITYDSGYIGEINKKAYVNVLYKDGAFEEIKIILLGNVKNKRV